MDGVTEELRTSINNLRHRSTAAKWKPLDQWSHDASSFSSRRLFITWSISWKGRSNNNKDRWLCVGKRIWERHRDIKKTCDQSCGVMRNRPGAMFMTDSSLSPPLLKHPRPLTPGSSASPAPLPCLPPGNREGGQAIDQTDYYQSPGCLSGCLLVSHECLQSLMEHGIRTTPHTCPCHPSTSSHPLQLYWSLQHPSLPPLSPLLPHEAW